MIVERIPDRQVIRIERERKEAPLAYRSKILCRLTNVMFSLVRKKSLSSRASHPAAIATSITFSDSIRANSWIDRSVRLSSVRQTSPASSPILCLSIVLMCYRFYLKTVILALLNVCKVANFDKTTNRFTFFLIPFVFLSELF